MADILPSATEPAGARQPLTALREALMQLHKALLDAEKSDYEANVGTISSSYHFLQLLTSDPWFAWLAPITHLLADVDALLDRKKPVTAAEVQALLQSAKTLLTPTETGEGFSRHYDEALQEHPDVLFAHATTMRVLRAATA